jgi:hypothetical protein
MKTERIEFVAPLGLKSRLRAEADSQQISIAELIRQRFEPSEEEKELAKLTTELKKSTAKARKDLHKAAAEVDTLVKELQARRTAAEREAA